MDFKVTYNNFESAMRAAKIFELRKQVGISVMEGKCRAARATQKELAKIGVEDFDTFKTVPGVRVNNLPLSQFFPMFLKGLKFKIYRAFTKKIPEEKQLAKMYKEYAEKLTPEEKAKLMVNVDFPRF